MAEELALSAEMHVVLMGRSKQKLQDVKAALEKEAARRGLPPPTLWTEMYDADDLSTIASGADGVTQLAKDKYDGKCLVLVNNAGAVAPDYSTSKQGADSMLARNFLAPHLLTTRLMPLLKAVARSGYKPRVVNVSSMGHALGHDFCPVRYDLKLQASAPAASRQHICHPALNPTLR